LLEKLKKRTFYVLDKAHPHDILSHIWDDFIAILILANVGAVVFETVPAVSQAYGHIIEQLDIFCVFVFTIEYVARLWSVTSVKKFSHPLFGRLRYAVTFHSVIDLLAILPFFLPLFLHLDLRFMHILRLFRVVRLLKIARYSMAMQRIIDVFRVKRGEFGVIACCIVVCDVFFSSIMYHVENAAQPDKFASILDAMWWGISTLTTVSYGDIFPITPTGKLMASLISLLGVIMFAVLSGIFASGFIQCANKAKERKKASTVCPKCGHNLVPTSRTLRTKPK